jgi:hypothetical protein
LAGVDYTQWKAVTRTLLRSDFRLPLTESRSGRGRAGGLLLMAVVLALFGAGAAVIVFINPDVLLTSTIALTYLSVMLASTLLTQHGATMLSTADYVILGARPVSSRTVLAIRLTNVLFHAMLVTTLMSVPVIVAFAVAHGGNVARGVAVAVAVYAWALLLSLGLITMYAAALRFAGAHRMQRVLGYVQLASGFFAYGGIVVAMRAFDNTPLATITMPDQWWLVVIPPAWYASYVEIASGILNSTTMLRAAMSVVAIAAMAWVIRDKLSLDYARQLAQLTTVSTSATEAIRTPLFNRAESRAVAILVRAHFEHDVRVRMGILAIVPLLFFYMFVGLRDGAVDVVGLAVLAFPAVLSRHFVGSDAYRAAWIYFAAPVDRSRLVLALKNVAVVYFLAPFLLLVFAVYVWRLADVDRAAVETVILGLLSHIALQGSMIVSPRLPFAAPPDKTTAGATLTAWLTLVIVGGQGALYAMDRWVYTSPARTMAVIALLIAVTLSLNRVVAWRARRV